MVTSFLRRLVNSAERSHSYADEMMKFAIPYPPNLFPSSKRYVNVAWNIVRKLTYDKVMQPKEATQLGLCLFWWTFGAGYMGKLRGCFKADGLQFVTEPSEKACDCTKTWPHSLLMIESVLP